MFTIVVIAVGGLLGRALAITQWKWRRRMQLQAWHLRQIVPTA